MAYLPSKELVKLIKKETEGELTEEEKKELNLRYEAEKPAKSEDSSFGFGLGFIIGSLFD